MPTEHRGEMVCKPWLHKAMPQPGRANEMVDAKEPTIHVRTRGAADGCGHAYLSTCIKSDTCERAGVPETAKDDIRGIRETISLQTFSIIRRSS